MRITLDTFLQAAKAIGSATSAVGAVRDILAVATEALPVADQATAKEALADLIADNDEGHARLQAKLDAAAGR